MLSIPFGWDYSNSSDEVSDDSWSYGYPEVGGEWLPPLLVTGGGKPPPLGRDADGPGVDHGPPDNDVPPHPAAVSGIPPGHHASPRVYDGALEGGVGRRGWKRQGRGAHRTDVDIDVTS